MVFASVDCSLVLVVIEVQAALIVTEGGSEVLLERNEAILVLV